MELRCQLHFPGGTDTAATVEKYLTVIVNRAFRL